MKNEKNRKLHGSVLLTVVVVMSLLIVFLFGTLALATAANNRAHVNYSSSQTGVTSRMVAQSAVEAMDASLTYKQVIGNVKNGDAPLDVNVMIGNTATFNAGALGNISPVQVEYAGTKKVYSTTKKQWIDNTVLKFTSKVSMGGVESQTSAYVLKITEPITKPGGGAGSGFRTTGAATVSCQTSLYGGTYINLPKDDYKYYEETLPSGDVRKPSFSGAATNMNNSGAVAEAPLYINNNVHVENWSGFIFPAKSTGITIWGDLEFSNNIGDADKCQYETSDGADFTNLQFNEIPYMYVDGAVKYGNALKVGNVGNTGAKTFPLNLFCGSIVGSGGTGKIELAADVYCMDAGATSNIEANNFGDTKLYSWSGSVINQAESAVAQPHAQSIYSKGNLKLKNIEIAGDVSCEGWCEINGTVKIHGNLTVKDNLKVNGGATLEVDGEIICKTHEGIADDKVTNADKKATLKPGYEKINTFEHDGKVNASNSIEVENAQIPYLVLNPANYRYYDSETGYDIGGSDLFGNKYDDVKNLVYTWRTDLTSAQITYILDLGNQTTADIAALDINDPEYETQRLDKWRYFYDEAKALIDETKPAFTEDSYPNGETTYRVKTYYDITTMTTYYGTEPVTEQYSYYDNATGVEVHDGEPYKTLPMWNPADAKYVDSNVKTDLDHVYASTTNPGVWVAEEEAVKTGEYYPQYAEREVVLGIKQLDDPNSSGKLSKDATRIVSTIDYLYNADPDKTLDPYSAGTSGLPTSFTATYESVKSNGYNLGNDADVNKLIAASGNAYVKSIGGAGSDPYKIELDNQADKSGMTGLYINKSCKLSGSYGSDGKDIVIDPNGTSLLIVIDDLTLGAGCNVIIDDSKGGNVTFFIDDNKYMTFCGSASYATISYMNMLKHYDGAAIQLANKYKETTDPSDPTKTIKILDDNYVVKDGGGNPYPNIAGDITDGDFTWLKERLEPSWEIRSGDGAKMTVENFELLTANIISSGLDLEIKATSTPLYSPSAFYYNGINIFSPTKKSTSSMTQTVYGCVNTKTANIPNQVQVIYASLGDGKSSTPPGVGNFDYSILYYDEY